MFSFNTEFEKLDIDQLLREHSGVVADQETEVTFESFKKQDTYIEAVLSGRYKELCYGGSIRSGKSFAGLGTLILLSKMFPKSKWVVVRESLPSLKRTTIPTFRKIVPDNFIKNEDKSLNSFVFHNDSEIFFMPESFSQDPDLDRFKGLEINGFLMEEANECREATCDILNLRAGANFLPNMPPAMGLYTVNPSQTWVKNRFYTPFVTDTMAEHRFFQPASILDNPHVPKGYIDDLKRSLPPPVYKRFVEGSWDAEDDANQLIGWKVINACSSPVVDNEEFSLGVDVATEGKDYCIFIVLKGGNIHEIIKWAKNDVPDIAVKILELSDRYKIPAKRAAIDAVGNGEGAWHICKKKKYNLIGIKGGSKPWATSDEEDFFTYYNLRSQLHWLLKRSMESGELGNVKEESLRTDLAALWYGIDKEKCIRIPSKDEFKKELGRSPDWSDAYIYANAARLYHRIRVMPGIHIF